MTEHELADNVLVKNSLEAIFRCLNGSNSKRIPETVRNVIATEHRTLQQAFFKQVVMPLVEQMAEGAKTGRFDARNEVSCKCAKKMMDALDPSDVYFPFI